MSLRRFTSVIALAAASWTPAFGAVTTATGNSPTGGTITLAITAGSSSCSFSSAFFLDPRLLSPPVLTPAGVSMPQGWFNFATEGCGAGASTTFTVTFPQALPPTAQWWKLGPTPDDRSSHWYTIPSSVNGNAITFTITDGGIGDDDLMMNGAIVDLGGLGIPGGMYQDLWWGGSLENGWGMSLVQHRDTLFANVYVYDASGNPVWYVMPSGTWNYAHTAFTGSLYLPTGSPFYAYDVSHFNVGTPVGTMTITFTDVNNATFDYTINGVTAHKNITRVLFGPNTPPTDHPHGDLWWAGSAQNGWGLAILQQYQTLFALWFTYDASGKAVWYVMPGGDWAVRDDYHGPVFKAVGPPWLGVPYDASRHHLTLVGTFELTFSGSDNATFSYSIEGKTGSIALTRIPF